MIRCNCGEAMVRADLYDPEGTIQLYGGKVVDGKWWICLICGSNPSLGVPPEITTLAELHQAQYERQYGFRYDNSQPQ